jgi:hypothetical protein
MPSRQSVIDALAVDARRANQDAHDCDEHARIHRARRDVLVRRLYASNLFTYQALSLRLGISAETVAKIVQDRSNRAKHK